MTSLNAIHCNFYPYFLTLYLYQQSVALFDAYIIEQVDTNDAQIECVDGNLHRQDIPTSELARAAKMKMEALARKAGRRSKMDQLTGPSKRTDQIVAEDMGMSRNQVNRLVRIDSLVPELKKRVDDKKLPFNTAVELSYLKPEEQGKVVDFMKKAIKALRGREYSLPLV